MTLPGAQPETVPVPGPEKLLDDRPETLADIQQKKLPSVGTETPDVYSRTFPGRIQDPVTRDGESWFGASDSNS